MSEHPAVDQKVNQRRSERRPLRTHDGFSLIEILGALAIGAIMLVGLFAMLNSSLDDVKDQQAALYQSQVVSAATQYVQANYNALIAKTTTNPLAPPILFADLTSPSAYLSPTTLKNNIYGQTFCVLVLQRPTNQLNALVVTYGGQDIPDVDLSYIAANSGAGGGYISNANPSLVQGPAWSLDATMAANFNSNPSCPLSAGHLASIVSYNGPGAMSGDFLYRDAWAPNTSLNTMNTPIIFGNNSVQTEGTPCVLPVQPTGQAVSMVASDANGAILSCQLGTWQKQQGQWKAPEPDYSSLPSTGNTVGDVRLETTDNLAFAWNGSNWVPLAADQNGTITVKNLQLTDIVVANTPCPTSGLVARDATGLVLSCQSGTWQNQFAFSLSSSENLCSVIMPSAFVASTCPTLYTGGYIYDAPVDTTFATINRPITLTRSGLAAINFSGHMNRGLSGCMSPSCPEGQLGLQITIYDNDTGLSVGTSAVQSIAFTNNSVGLNDTLLQALPLNKTGYTAQLMVAWSLFINAIGIYNQSSATEPDGTLIQYVPITVNWTLTVFS